MRKKKKKKKKLGNPIIKIEDLCWSKARLRDLEECIRLSRSDSKVFPFEGRLFDRGLAKFMLFRFSGIYID
jgi:hypothetical protein